MDFQVKVVLTCLLFTPKTFPGAFQWLPGPNSVIDSPVGALRWTQFWKRFGKVLSFNFQIYTCSQFSFKRFKPFQNFSNQIANRRCPCVKIFYKFQNVLNQFV